MSIRTEHSSLRQGLVGAWCPSLGASGLSLIDRSGRNNHGTLTNMAGQDNWPSSGSGVSINFDGTNDYADLGSRLPSTFDKQTIRLSCVRRTAKKQSLISSYTASPQGGWGIEILANNTINYFGFQNTTTFTDVQTSQTISANSWTDVVCTFDAGVFSIYLNGVLAASKSGVSSIYNTSSVRLGATIANADFFNGQLDDIRIYNRALTAAEIRLLASRRGIGLTPLPDRAAGLPRKLSVNVGGTWREADSYVNVGGVWKLGQVTANVGGTWR
jgi:hypothetical protein